MALALVSLAKQQADAFRLAIQPRLKVDFSRLRPVDQIDLDAAWRAADGEAWKERAPALEQLLERRAGGGIGGALNLGDRRAIYGLIRALRPGRVLEIGTHLGASTLYGAAALQDNGAGDLTTVDIVDVNGPQGAWVRAGAHRSPAEAIAALGMEARVRFVVSDSLEFLRTDEGGYDFCFLDGSHSAKWVYNEVQLVQERLNPGAVILLHDVFPGNKPLWPASRPLPGPWMALSRLAGEGAPLKLKPLGALPWPTKAGSHVTSLALLGRA